MVGLLGENYALVLLFQLGFLLISLYLYRELILLSRMWCAAETG